MPIETQSIDGRQRDLILNAREGHFLDLKAVDVAPAKLSRTIAAFANADGGEIYVGIDERPRSRAWRGFPDPEAANAHVQVFEQLFPLGRDFQYLFLECEGEAGLVLQVQIRKTPDIKRSSDGTIYLRRSAQNLPVTNPDAIRRLEFTKGLSSFENEVVQASMDVLTNSVPTIEFMLQVVPLSEPSVWLSKQQLIRDSRPTVGGVLLFAEEPQALLPKRSGIKIYRYKTKQGEGSRETLAFDPITIEGHAYAQIKSAVATTTEVVEEIRKLGTEGLELVKYPPETIHEIITNAVLHRDYSVADDIHVRIFDNRIEVESPGRLPAHITPTNILDERFARNGTLVRILNKFPDPPNKDVGEGLNTAFAAMHRLGLKEPTIRERETSVLVSIKHEPLASPEELILEYLENHETIWNKKAREITHIGADYVVRNAFLRLEARQLIERMPGTERASTRWRKGAKFAQWRKEGVRDGSEGAV